MEWLDEGVVISQRRHGESAAIVSLFTSIHGRHAGLARGAKGVRSRGVYQQGNQVTVSWRARLSEHLGTFNCELKDARAARIINNPLQLAALSSVCALIEVGLPERHPYPDLYHSTIDLMDLFDDDDTWPGKLVFWELQLLAELGFGLDLSACAVTGEKNNLTYVSPRSGRAVTNVVGAPYAHKLLRLPNFILEPSIINPQNKDILSGLKLSGWFIARYLLEEFGGHLPPARERLVDYWKNLS